MTWNRYGSEFTRDRRWDAVPYDARWHYIAVVAECSDSERFDCRIPLRLALRASDVPDPQAATDALVAAGFAVIDGSDFVIVDGEHRHMPPPHLRDEHRKEGQRKRTYRSRLLKCERGEHDGHCPPSCPERGGNGSGNALPQNSTEQSKHLSEGVCSEPSEEDQADLAAFAAVARGEASGV